MKKSFYIVASLALTCIFLAGCKKWIEEPEPESKEDLSYLIKTYDRYESNGHIYKSTWTYDGYKPTGYQYYVDGQLYFERKNYTYNGLNASYDSYSYRDGDVNDVTVSHYECEYLDETFLRLKYQKYYYPNSESNNIYEFYYEYDGKKRTITKSYINGTLINESHRNYNDLHCTYTQKWYSSSGVFYEQRFYDIVYLDDAFLRDKSFMRTIERYDEEGNVTTSTTDNYFYDYDGKKPIGFRFYNNGKLTAIGRDYQYDGLTSYYYHDEIQDGEVVASRMYEVEYLE